MEEQKISLFNFLLSAVFIFPAMINAIIRSIFLIHNGFGAVALENTMVGYPLVLALVFTTNMVLAIAAMIILLIQFGLIQSGNKKAKIIGDSGKIIIMISSLISILIVWMTAKVSDLVGQTSFYVVSRSWLIAFISSAVFFIYDKIRR